MGEENKKRERKLVLAVLQGEDYAGTVDELNRSGFSATILSSTGGFLKKKSVTIMIGVDAAKLERVMDILRRCAGNRQQLAYSSMNLHSGTSGPVLPMMPVQIQVGGAVVFVLDLESLEKM